MHNPCGGAMSRLLLMLMAPLAQSAFDPELAGPASVLVRGFWPLQVDRISVADSQVDVSGTFDINFMFLGPDLDMATYYGSEEDSSGSTLDYLTSMKVNPPGVTDGGSYKGYTQYDISRDAETMANVNTWMNNKYFFSTYCKGDKPEWFHHISDGWKKVYLADDPSAACDPAEKTWCTATKRHFPFVLALEFRLRKTCIQHNFDFARYPLDVHEVSLVITNYHFGASQWSSGRWGKAADGLVMQGGSTLNPKGCSTSCRNVSVAVEVPYADEDTYFGGQFLQLDFSGLSFWFRDFFK